MLCHMESSGAPVGFAHCSDHIRRAVSTLLTVCYFINISLINASNNDASEWISRSIINDPILSSQYESYRSGFPNFRFVWTPDGS